MTNEEFHRLAGRYRMRDNTRRAVRLVLVDGYSGYAAARECGVAQSTVWRAVRRLDRPLCTGCGRPMPAACDE